jgi:hypothetical protein
VARSGRPSERIVLEVLSYLSVPGGHLRAAGIQEREACLLDDEAGLPSCS